MPSKIEGYRVHSATVVLTREAIDPKQRADVVIRLNEPRVGKLGLLGATVEISGEMFSRERSGEIERIRFHDVRVNEIAVSVEEIAEGFSFKSGERRPFSPTANVTISAAALAKGALRELTAHRDDWTVTGTAFVFGRFKRFGFTFKRVIPVNFDLTIKNPLR